IPKRGVYGVVVDFLTVVGKSIRQQSIADASGELLENLGCQGTMRGGQRQARQGDHGVPPPIGEPWIAGDDGMTLAALHDELVGCRCQFAADRLAPSGLLTAEFGYGSNFSRFQRGDYGALWPGVQFEIQHEGLKEVFGKLEPAPSLFRVF